MKAALSGCVIVIACLLVGCVYLIRHTDKLKAENEVMQNDLKYFQAADSLNQITIKKCLDFNNPK